MDEQAEVLARNVVEIYGEALERILTIVHDELGERSEPIFDRLCADELVESLLCLHGLHPIAVEERVEQALQSVLPYVKSHKGNMEISRIEGDVVYLRLEGSCDGCAASATTLKLSVDDANLELAALSLDRLATINDAMAARCGCDARTDVAVAETGFPAYFIRLDPETRMSEVMILPRDGAVASAVSN